MLGRSYGSSSSHGALTSAGSSAITGSTPATGAATGTGAGAGAATGTGAGAGAGAGAAAGAGAGAEVVLRPQPRGVAKLGHTVLLLNAGAPKSPSGRPSRGRSTLPCWRRDTPCGRR